MKKITLLILCVVMITLCACDNAQPQTSATATVTVSTEVTNSVEATASISPTIPKDQQYYYDNQYYYDHYEELGEYDQTREPITRELASSVSNETSIIRVIEVLGKPHYVWVSDHDHRFFVYYLDDGYNLILETFHSPIIERSGYVDNHYKK